MIYFKSDITCTNQFDTPLFPVKISGKFHQYTQVNKKIIAAILTLVLTYFRYIEFKSEVRYLWQATDFLQCIFFGFSKIIFGFR